MNLRCNIYVSYSPSERRRQRGRRGSARRREGMVQVADPLSLSLSIFSLFSLSLSLPPPSLSIDISHFLSLLAHVYICFIQHSIIGSPSKTISVPEIRQSSSPESGIRGLGRRIIRAGAGITAAAGTRLALQSILVKGFKFYSFQLQDTDALHCWVEDAELAFRPPPLRRPPVDSKLEAPDPSSGPGCASLRAQACKHGICI